MFCYDKLECIFSYLVKIIPTIVVLSLLPSFLSARAAAFLTLTPSPGEAQPIGVYADLWFMLVSYVIVSRYCLWEEAKVIVVM